MNSSLQNAGFQLSASHLAALAQPLPHLPISSTPFASLQTLQKSAALQQLALQSSLNNLYRQQNAAPTSSFQPQSNVAAAAAAAALLAASQVAQLQTAQSAPPPVLNRQPFVQPNPAANPLIHAQNRVVDNAALELAHLQALAAVAAARPAVNSSPTNHDAIFQAAAAAAAAVTATNAPYTNSPPPPQTPLDASPLLLSSPNTAGNQMWPHPAPAASQQQLDPQLMSALLSGLLNNKPEIQQNPVPASYNPSYSPQAANLLAHSLSLPANLSLQDILTAQALKQEEAASWQVPQRATWHAQPPALSSAPSAPIVQRNSLDVRPANSLQGQPLHLHHAGITHAGGRSPPNLQTKKSAAEHTPAPAASKPAVLDPQVACNAAVQNLAKLINQAGIVAGRKKSTQEDGDSAGKDEFKQRILVQVGEKLARAGFTVEQAVKAGLLGGMYVGEVKVLCAAHAAEVKNIQQEKENGIAPPPEETDDTLTPTELSPKAQSVPLSSPITSTPFAHCSSPSMRTDASKSTPRSAASLQPPPGVSVTAARVQSAPATSNHFDAFSYGFFGTDSDDSLLEELELSSEGLDILAAADGTTPNVAASLVSSLHSSGSLDSSSVQSSVQSMEGRANSQEVVDGHSEAASPDSRFTLFVANDEEVKPFGKSAWQSTKPAGQSSPGLWRKGGAAVQMHAAARQLAELQL